MDASKLIQDIIAKASMIHAVFHSARDKKSAQKISMRPIHLKGSLFYQVSEQQGQKVLHQNLSPKEYLPYLLQLLQDYKRGVIFTDEADFYFLMNQKGIAKVLKKKPTKKEAILPHNRPKQYLLDANKPLPFLIELGVMQPSGKIAPQKYDKFRQINRFLEMVEDILEHFSTKKTIHIVDFGCGKAYLTFALYYYLKELKGLDIALVGIDLKEDVIAFCRDLAKKLDYQQLKFQAGKISDYRPKEGVDLVIALHACNTATDDALAEAVRWGAKAILAAPCCQHELYDQLENTDLDALLRYGIIKERMAALITDAARAEILEMHGYATQIVEFIDSEHTPKNLMIRAIKGHSEERQAKATSRYISLKQMLSIAPSLEKKLHE